AEEAARDAEQRALLGLDSITDEVLSLMINEGQATYEGEGYERVMLHAVLGMCYLTRGDPYEVLVEARRVDELLTGEQQLYETEYRAGGIGHLLSAIAYELVGKPDEAYIDYLRMYEKGLGEDLVESALLRLSRTLGRTDELEHWRAQFGAESGEVPSRDAPSIVLLGGLGMGPAKNEARIDIPIDGGIFSWAIPQMGTGWSPTQGLELVFPDHGVRLRSSLVEDVATVARKNLADRIGWLAARSAARGLLKRELARNLKDDEDTEWLGYALEIFNIATERADLRAWRTLPQKWVGARAFLPIDEPVAIELAMDDGQTVSLGTYRLQPGETMFVIARALGSGLHAHVVGGEVLGEDPIATSTPSIPSDPQPLLPGPTP
ncbi:MAG: hypothetical protein AAGA20_24700, partial [Planctomycetota bacterium]